MEQKQRSRCRPCQVTVVRLVEEGRLLGHLDRLFLPDRGRVAVLWPASGPGSQVQRIWDHHHGRGKQALQDHRMVQGHGCPEKRAGSEAVAGG